MTSRHPIPKPKPTSDTGSESGPGSKVTEPIPHATTQMQTETQGDANTVPATKPTPEDDAKAKKIGVLSARIEYLNAEIAATQERLKITGADLKAPASHTVKTHIHLLHQYNEIRDIGQGLIGMVAEQRNASFHATGTGGTGNGNVRVRDLYEEFGVGLTD